MASSGASRKLARGLTACQRCRRRKQKCDLKHPACSNCSNAGTPCLIFDSTKKSDVSWALQRCLDARKPLKKAQVPRDYVSRLEAQIEQLNAHVHSTESTAQGPSNSLSSPLSSAEGTVARSPVDSFIDRPSQSTGSFATVSAHPDAVAPLPNLLGASSRHTLARMVTAMIRGRKLPASPASNDSDCCAIQSLTPGPDKEASLPPRRAADHLVEVYFQYRTPHLPIIDRKRVEDALSYVYASGVSDEEASQVAQKHIFTTYLVLAIALCDLPDPENLDARGRPYQSQSCFFSALRAAEQVLEFASNEVETLRAVLLIAQFVALNPALGNLWHLVGVSIRLCVDLGLHTENRQQPVPADPNEVQERRKLFYSAYHFDRMLSITLSRPFGILDESVSVPLPHPWARSSLASRNVSDEVYYQRAHNHMFSMSGLESEIQLVRSNQTQTPSIVRPKIDYTAWLADVEPRLREWHDTVPPTNKAHPSSVFALQAFWDSMYNNARLLLYRPYSTTEHQSAEVLSVVYEASCGLIENIKVLQSAGKCESLWKTVHQLFMAGVGVLYALWQSNMKRDHRSSLEHTIVLQSCCSTLTAMAETFPPASSYRDVFNSLVSSVTNSFNANDEAEINRSYLYTNQYLREILSRNANLSHNS